MNSGVRVSIPNSVRKTIQNIKEITGNHSEDEIYVMLKECSMDPNETAQKLLLQDPFHEVRRKRDRKKENPNKESTEPRWKPGMQGRGNRGGRGNYPSRHNSHDAGSNRNVVSGKENELNQSAKDGVILLAPQDKKNKEKSVIASSSIVVPDGIPSDLVSEKTSTLPDGHLSKTPLPSSGVYLSASDPILMPSQDSRIAVGTIKREVGSQRIPVDQVKETPLEIKTASGSEVVQGKLQSEFQGEGNNLVSESSRPSSNYNNRPPSNYNNRPQQAIGPQKVGPGKEWKPKPTNPIPAQVPVTSDSIQIPPISVEPQSTLKPESSITDSEVRKQEESHIPDVKHVIIPNHLHVPEAEKLGFRFGSFDFHSTSLSVPVTDTCPLPEASEEHTSTNQDVVVTADDEDHPDRPSSSSNVPESLSTEGDVAPEPKQDPSLPTTKHQYPVVHPSSNLSFGFMPPIIGSHLAPFDNTESQVRDVSRVPSFVVQQPFDPSSYYPHFYRSGGENDGRVSPFHPTKASQSSQEGGNSSMLSSGGPTPLATQSSIAVTQQPLPVFRQPAGLHLPHYPPNYIPYGPYFSPFYISPPAIHQFLSNGGFPQQAQGGNMYTVPPVPNPKYPLPQYKPGSNAGNPGHVGAYGPYGSTPAVSGGNSTSNDDLGGSQFKENNVYVTGQQSEGPGVWIAAGPGRDISGSFYNLPQGGQVAYTTPTQPTHGTFASIYHHPAPPVTTGPLHPLLQQSQTMAGGVDMAGPTSSMYQQQQPPPPQPAAQINWPNNY